MGPFVRPSARVTDLGRHVTDDEHDLVAHALEAAQHEHGHGVAEVQFGARRVDAELGNERPALRTGFREPFGQRLRRGLELLGPVGHQSRLFGRGEVGEVHQPAGVGELEELTDHVFGAQVSLCQQGAGVLDGTAEPAHLGPLCDMAWLPSLVCRAIPTPADQASRPRRIRPCPGRAEPTGALPGLSACRQSQRVQTISARVDDVAVTMKAPGQHLLSQPPGRSTRPHEQMGSSSTVRPASAPASSTTSSTSPSSLQPRSVLGCGQGRRQTLPRFPRLPAARRRPGDRDG